MSGDAMEIDTRSEIGNRLAGVEVIDVTGATMLLGDLWREGTVVLAFVRHFG